MVTIAQIYDWFMTGKKPTQAQFWASWGSFWNKLEQIPQSAIAGLTAVLNAKAEKSQFDAHKVDAAAHADLFEEKVDKVAGKQLSTEDYTTVEKNKLAYLDETKDIDKPVSTLQAAADGVVLVDAKIHADSGDSQLKGGAPLDADTLKKINDKVVTLQGIVGGTTPDGDSIVNTLTELLAVLTSYPEGTDLFTLVQGKVAKTDIYNALDCIVSGKAADARQLKVLNDALTTLTTNVNNKVDKATGERLINASEITKLAGIGNITVTIKSILSTALASQDVAGMVSYINTLAVVLAVGNNETVKYKTTDTGRVFELLLRGRSFGVGQPAIVAADVLEVTEFLNKDIKLSNYPNTRNDGQLPTNRVLSTDANGNLKMYTIATAPAPYLEILIPDSTLPSTTTNFVLKGAFFTPTMTVAIVGQTINYITFVSDNLVKVNVTTGATEGLYAVTLNNGLSATFANALSIVLGTVFVPLASDFISVVNLEAINGGLNILAFNSQGSAKWVKPFSASVNWEFRYQTVISPLATPGVNYGYENRHILFKRVSDNVNICNIVSRWYAPTSLGITYFVPDNGYYGAQLFEVDKVTFENTIIRVKHIASTHTVYVYANTNLVATYVNLINEDMYIEVVTPWFNIKNMKYIELAS